MPSLSEQIDRLVERAPEGPERDWVQDVNSPARPDLTRPLLDLATSMDRDTADLYDATRWLRDRMSLKGMIGPRFNAQSAPVR